jgi:uncharacterized delta-60 repeat protein
MIGRGCRFGFAGTALVIIMKVSGAPGDVDLAFNAGQGHVNRIVKKVVAQPDGKIILGGSFVIVRGAARNRIARLKQDGTADLSFDPGSGADKDVDSIALQSDGKVIVVGQFTTINGTSRNRVARLNADGSLDDTFQPGSGANGEVMCVGLDAEGKVLIGGIFISFNGATRNRIARLNANGRLDTSFNPGVGPNSTVSAVAAQSDGKVLIGGYFSTVAGMKTPYLARLNTNGTPDTTFKPGTGPDNTVLSILARGDDKIVIGGGLTKFNGTTRNHIAGLNQDGSLDTLFNPGTGADGGILSIDSGVDGELLIGGYFTSYGGKTRLHVARVKADGSLDSTFDPGSGPDILSNSIGPVNSVAIVPNGKVAVGGLFSTMSGQVRNRIAQLNADGTLDPTFVPGTGINERLAATALQSDRKIVIGGDFTAIDQTVHNHIARLNSDGAVDRTFNTDADGSVGPIVIQPDGKILVAGAFSFVNGTFRKGIARLSSNGSLDTGFDPGSGVDFGVQALLLLPDGKILLGGTLGTYNNVIVPSVIRINRNASLDSTFDAGPAPISSLNAMALQPDGKIVLGGQFGLFGQQMQFTMRLNEDGSEDKAFTPATNADNNIYAVVLQEDGKILVAGNFTTMNGKKRSRIARLNSDGTTDLTFDPGAGADYYINIMALQTDNKILIGGAFSNFNRVQSSRIARLNPNGSLDTNFNVGKGVDGNVVSIDLQSDGNALIAGEFVTVNGIDRPYIARLFAAPGPLLLEVHKSSADVELLWTDTTSILQAAPAVTGPYMNVPGAVSPYLTNTVVSQQFFRLFRN